MKRNQRWALGLMTSLLLLFAGWTALGQRKERTNPPVMWEYKIVYDGNGDRRAEERIAPLGAQGWELVGAVRAADSTEITLFFKRAK